MMVWIPSTFSQFIYILFFFHQIYFLFKWRGKKSLYFTVWIHCESSCFLSIAVSAPTSLGFGQVGPDSIEVNWVAPYFPNSAEINNFLIRYEKKHHMLYLNISDSHIFWGHTDSHTNNLFVVLLIIQVSSHWRWRWHHRDQHRRQQEQCGAKE